VVLWLMLCGFALSACAQAPTASPSFTRTAAQISFRPDASKRPSVTLASYYSSGRRTANGERFNARGLTAAHRYLSFGTKLRVTNVHSGQSVIVRVNDRGPFVKSRSVDLSRSAAQEIGMLRQGIAKVRIEVVQ
jgi:peptidoglycan lytic transglycosylase